MTSKRKLDHSEIYYNLTDALRAKENQIQIFKYLISFLFYNFFLNGHTWENIMTRASNKFTKQFQK